MLFSLKIPLIDVSLQKSQVTLLLLFKSFKWLNLHPTSPVNLCCLAENINNWSLDDDGEKELVGGVGVVMTIGQK